MDPVATPGSNLVQPFRRNLNFDPIIIPVGLTGISTPIAPMTGGGVTTFKMHNPNPFWVWYRGWSTGGIVPVAGKGHLIAPGAVDICRTQMPSGIAAAGSARPTLPLSPTGSPVLDTDGCLMWEGVRCELVMIYGSGA